PCYGQAHFLADAVESLRAQTLPPAEILVVDDGSPDDVPAAVAGFPEVRVVRQENRGLSGARNRGLAETTAPFVHFLDADDTLRPHALETLRSWMIARPEAALAWGFNQPYNDDGRPIGWGATSFDGVPGYAALLEQNVVGAPVGALFRREPLESVGGFAEDLDACEDWELYLRLARLHSIGCVGVLLADYRHHGSNMSTKNALMYASACEVLARQERWVRGRSEWEAALARGRRHVEVRYGFPARIDHLRALTDAGRWADAAVQGARLAIRFPGAVIGALLDRGRRG
ncbi:MAG: glycosyltransferase, partial [Gemmatimonadetes bacterium]|nr:glycosyltransferase [Gemmatimonadota bacterium]